MTSEPKPEVESSLVKNATHWWWQDDTYIANGKVSWIAVLEIPAAMAFYWWLANFFERPWVLLITACAAPILLLRSEASVHYGVALLGEVLDKKTLKKYVFYSIGLITCTLGVYLCYGLIHGMTLPWLADISGWRLISLGALLGALAGVGFSVAVTAIMILIEAVTDRDRSFEIAATCAVTIALAGAAVVATVISITTVGMEAAVVTFWIVGLGVVVVASYRARFKANVRIGSIALGGMYGLLHSISYILISLLIRFIATLKYLKAGITAFSHNWRETVLVSDIRHAPALLPRAGEVNSHFNVASLLNKPTKSFFSTIVNSLTAFAYYLTATLYRWNIKASAWLWGPIALVFKPTNWLDDEDMRAKSSFWSTWLLVGLLFGISFTLLINLANPYIPSDWLILKSWLKAILEKAQAFNLYFPAPQVGLRFILLALLTLTIFLMFLFAYEIRSAHDKALTGAGDYRNYPPEIQERMKIMALKLRRILKCNTALSIVTVWAFTLKYAIDHYPDVTAFKPFIPLAPWL